MSALVWVLIAVGVILVLLVVFYLGSRRRSTRLRREFGPEYERTVDQEGRRSGEAELRQRTERRQRFEIRDLSLDASARYSESWRLVQERFVDIPSSRSGR
jgi:hypothetical protein